MATTTRGRKADGTGKRSTPAGRAKRPASCSRKTTSSLETVRETAGGYAGNALKTIRRRPYTAALLAAGTAGAAAFLWAKRALIGEQAAVAREKLGELRDQASDQVAALREEAGERAKGFRGKLNERFFATGEATAEDLVNDVKRGARKAQRELSREALSLKELGEKDSILPEQSKVGAIAY